MKALFEKIQELSDDAVDFYSVRLGENQLTEFELFDERDFPDHREELQIIYNVIDQMRSRGARQYFFKQEGPANALPRVGHQIIEANKNDYGLRLYCIRLTDELVVLLNGDVKTKQNPLDCENVQVHFSNAVKIARQIDKNIFHRELNCLEPDVLVDYKIDI